MSHEALDITVVGHGAATYPPEQCTLSLTVRTDGRTAESASEPAQQLVRELTRLVEPLYSSDRGPIDRWSVDQVRHSRNRPFNHDGEQLPYVYQAEASVEVQFSQLDLVDAFVYAASALEGVSIDHFDWALTESSRISHTLAVRELAVRDAVAKAEAYASSLGRTSVHAVAIADPGLLPGSTEHGGSDASPRLFAAKSASAGFALKPENITITASVHARFTAS
ncbi:SIMPL domain-containing protein [Rhodococcus sp. IEGM 1381]|uniref:SIMPL domain-containing protein n=1 Tax=Rhodococcus sp. IEGM 1381 TaxID=3047085 RepID=UPI0024B749AF|nr:SIMPL domain-containing protein [Rhodococcus sp. IEGM 1381]MDI9896119.1 SIMPL domain-containing protein [Rhodococcus sp. IEGM 1381]